jgi:hypothetical protein
MANTLRFSIRMSALLVLFVSLKSALGSDADRDEFVREAPMAWRQYLLKLNHIRATLRFERRNPQDGELIGESSSTQIEIDGIRYLARSPFPAVSDATESVQGRNAKYSFSLMRDRDRRQWAIQEVTLGVNADAVQRTLDQAVQGPRNIALGLSDLPGPLFPELVDSPKFHLHDVRKVAVNERTLTEVHYEYRIAEPGKNDRNTVSRKGWIRLDPARYWLLDSAEFSWLRYPSDEIGSGRIPAVEFGEVSGQLPYVRKKIVELNIRELGIGAKTLGITQPEGELRQVSESELSFVPDQRAYDFTLSAFGLPEPVRPGIRWWWVLALVFGATLVAVPAWRSRKSQK